MQLKGTKVVITGGSTGLGNGLVRALVERGAKVVALDINAEVGQRTIRGLDQKFGPGVVHFLQCDVTIEKVFEDCFKKAVQLLGHVDLMVNNAGLINESRWQHMLNVNINGVVIGTQLAVEHMRKDKGGKGGVIINTASIAGLSPRYTFPIYSASKRAVTGFTESWATNPYLPFMGIRFGTVCPSSIDTPFQQFEDEQVLYPTEYRRINELQTIMPVEQAVEGYLQLIEDDESNGSNLLITSKGVQFKQQILQDGKGAPPINNLDVLFRTLLTK